MDQLHYVTELTERIKVKVAGEGSWQEGEDSAEFVRFFPAFVWAVRDFVLQLELDRQEITEDEYLENGLKLKTGSSRRAQLHNLPRECIRQFFPARKCFVFVQPAGRRDLPRLEELQEDELEPEFREQVARFCRHVWETSKPKTIPGGHVVTGATELLGTLAVTYVDAIRSGAVPCMESAVLALAQMENSAAVGEAVAVYEEQLARRAALPTESVQELLELHAQCEREALRAFMARAFKDDDRSFQGELMRRLEEQKQEICRRNELASLDRCTATLLELSDELDDQIGQGVYLVPGGYQRFLDDQWHVVDRNWHVPGKGIKPVAMEEPMCLVGNGADGEQDGYKQGNNTVTSRAAIENEAALREPGGYQAYDRDQNQVLEDYRANANKGVKAEETLEQFLASKKAKAEAVLKADILLTEARSTWLQKGEANKSPLEFRSTRWLEAVKGNECPGAKSGIMSQLRDSKEEEPVVGLQQGSQTQGAVLMQVINGLVLSALVKSYVDTTHSGNMPCLEDAVTATENKMGVTEALAHYVAETETRVAFPAAMMELSERHGKSLADALQLFMQLSLKAETVRYQLELMKHTDGVYMLPGGYQDLRDQSHVVNFRTTPNNGVKAEEVLDQFLASETAATDAILRADKTLTEAEEEKAREKQEGERLEQQRKAAEEKRLQTEPLVKDQERSHQENVKQLEAKVAEELAGARQEAERALESKVKEQEAMLQKGFAENAGLMEDAISGLREEIRPANASRASGPIVPFRAPDPFPPGPPPWATLRPLPSQPCPQPLSSHLQYPPCQTLHSWQGLRLSFTPSQLSKGRSAAATTAQPPNLSSPPVPLPAPEPLALSELGPPAPWVFGQERTGGLVAP
ncbi:unnamed protein product [Caretta caretta]